MIDLSNLKAPGWSRVVADLTTPAPDDRSYLAKMLAILVQVSGARQGVLYAPAASRDEGAPGSSGSGEGAGGGGGSVVRRGGARVHRGAADRRGGRGWSAGRRERLGRE